MSRKIKNPYDKTVFGVGYIGKGKYNHKDYPYIYRKWSNMLMRCYEPYTINKRPTYIDCYVCDEWHSFQNFASWFEENMYECNNERIELDKDILIKGNKIYSPNTCLLVPQRINTLIIKCNKSRGEFPIGVSWHKTMNKFCAYCTKESKKQIHLGYYDTVEDAFTAYKSFKENYIKEVADEYKDIIPTKLYDALCKYEVDIND